MGTCDRFLASVRVARRQHSTARLALDNVCESVRSRVYLTRKERERQTGLRPTDQGVISRGPLLTGSGRRTQPSGQYAEGHDDRFAPRSRLVGPLKCRMPWSVGLIFISAPMRACAIKRLRCPPPPAPSPSRRPTPSRTRTTRRSSASTNCSRPAPRPFASASIPLACPRPSSRTARLIAPRRFPVSCGPFS